MSPKKYVRNLTETGFGRTKKICVWEHGDPYSRCHEIHINPNQFRTWNSVLSYLTKILQPVFGAVYKLVSIKTKKCINTFKELEHNGRYIAVGVVKNIKIGNEYKTASKEDLLTQRHVKRFYSGEIDESELRFISETQKRNLRVIYVLVSGVIDQAPSKVVLTGSDILSWGLILDYLSNILDVPNGVKCLCTIYGDIIVDTAEIQHGYVYVALPHNQKFVHMDYMMFFNDWNESSNKKGFLSSIRPSSRRYNKIMAYKSAKKKKAQLLDDKKSYTVTCDDAKADECNNCLSVCNNCLSECNTTTAVNTQTQNKAEEETEAQTELDIAAKMKSAETQTLFIIRDDTVVVGSQMYILINIEEYNKHKEICPNVPEVKPINSCFSMDSICDPAECDKEEGEEKGTIMKLSTSSEMIAIAETEKNIFTDDVNELDTHLSTAPGLGVNVSRINTLQVEDSDESDEVNEAETSAKILSNNVKPQPVSTEKEIMQKDTEVEYVTVTIIIGKTSKAISKSITGQDSANIALSKTCEARTYCSNIAVRGTLTEKIQIIKKIVSDVIFETYERLRQDDSDSFKKDNVLQLKSKVREKNIVKNNTPKSKRRKADRHSSKERKTTNKNKIVNNVTNRCKKQKICLNCDTERKNISPGNKHFIVNSVRKGKVKQKNIDGNSDNEQKKAMQNTNIKSLTCADLKKMKICAPCEEKENTKKEESKDKSESMKDEPKCTPEKTCGKKNCKTFANSSTQSNGNVPCIHIQNRTYINFCDFVKTGNKRTCTNNETIYCDKSTSNLVRCPIAISNEPTPKTNGNKCCFCTSLHVNKIATKNDSKPPDQPNQIDKSKNGKDDTGSTSSSINSIFSFQKKLAVQNLQTAPVKPQSKSKSQESQRVSVTAETQTQGSTLIKSQTYSSVEIEKRLIDSLSVDSISGEVPETDKQVNSARNKAQGQKNDKSRFPTRVVSFSNKLGLVLGDDDTSKSQTKSEDSDEVNKDVVSINVNVNVSRNNGESKQITEPPMGFVTIKPTLKSNEKLEDQIAKSDNENDKAPTKKGVYSPTVMFNGNLSEKSNGIKAIIYDILCETFERAIQQVSNIIDNDDVEPVAMKQKHYDPLFNTPVHHSDRKKSFSDEDIDLPKQRLVHARSSLEILGKVGDSKDYQKKIESPRKRSLDEKSNIPVIQVEHVTDSSDDNSKQRKNVSNPNKKASKLGYSHPCEANKQRIIEDECCSCPKDRESSTSPPINDKETSANSMREIKKPAKIGYKTHIEDDETAVEREEDVDSDSSESNVSIDSIEDYGCCICIHPAEYKVNVNGRK